MAEAASAVLAKPAGRHVPSPPLAAAAPLMMAAVFSAGTGLP
jgi:hypothetical protein